MRRLLLLILLCSFARAEAAELNLQGITGLIAIPTADTVENGTAAAGASRHNPKPGVLDKVDDYYATVGFLPGFEVGGTIVEDVTFSHLKDLSANVKYQVWKFSSGPAIAVGVQDLGGEARNFVSTYAVGTVPLGPFKVTAGYGNGPDVMKGAIGGIEFQPWRFLSVMADYDDDGTNEGLRVNSGTLLGAFRLCLTAAHRGATGDTEYGAHIEFPLGRREEALAPASSATPAAPQRTEPAADAAALRAKLTELGFESVQVGDRGPDTLVVSLENRRYNQSSADGIGLALGVMAARAPDSAKTLELQTSTYGVPQETVTVPAGAWRDFLRDPGAGAAASGALQAKPAGYDSASGVAWSNAADPLRGMELVVEPVLRTFVATEFGVVDYAAAARARATAALSHGLIANVAATAPVDSTHDFRDGGNFASVRPLGGLDLGTIQYLQKANPQWSWLWTVGRMRVFRSDWTTLGLEQAWISQDGAHLLRAKLMALHNESGSTRVSLVGYSWFDPSRDYGIAITGGRFYAGDSGVRLEWNRYFGDTIVGLFFKGASRDDQAAGIQVSLPLTPRQDMAPGLVQVKGSRRWGHSVSSTINSSDGMNHLRPLLLYEPQPDLDLRRDILDSGRLGEDYLRDELPRMREAYELWGRD